MAFWNPDIIWAKIQQGIFVIAEIGKNFIQTEEEKSTEEYLENAKRLVDEAVIAGADAVKFQTHNVADEQMNISVVSPHFKGSDRYNWVKRNTELTPVGRFWKPLKAYCEEKGIVFFSTAMSRGAAKLLNEKVHVDLWKIGSGDMLDFVMLDYMRNTDKPIIISSGMSTFEEVKKAVRFLSEKNPRVALLHCVSRYPCPPGDLRINTILFYKKRLDMPIGFSDHSLSIESCEAAVAIGATILEKHFSLSRDLWGSDHKVSLTPFEFKELVSRVRFLEENPAKRELILKNKIMSAYFGKEEKIIDSGEKVFRPLFRKTLVAGADISAGQVITAGLLYAMRPQAHISGFPSEAYEYVIGKITKKDIKKYDPITESVI